MNAKRGVQALGIVGMVAAVLTALALFVQDRYGLEPPGGAGLLYLGDNTVLLIGLVGDVVMLVGLWRSGAAGEGIFGKISLGIFIAGAVLLFTAQAAGLFSVSPDLLVVAGGLSLLLGGLLTGIAVVTARHWDGWQRFAPLVQGLYFLVFLVASVIFGQSFVVDLVVGGPSLAGDLVRHKPGTLYESQVSRAGGPTGDSRKPRSRLTT